MIDIGYKNVVIEINFLGDRATVMGPLPAFTMFYIFTQVHYRHSSPLTTGAGSELAVSMLDRMGRAAAPVRSSWPAFHNMNMNSCDPLNVLAYSVEARRWITNSAAVYTGVLAVPCLTAWRRLPCVRVIYNITGTAGHVRTHVLDQWIRTLLKKPYRRGQLTKLPVVP